MPPFRLDVGIVLASAGLLALSGCAASGSRTRAAGKKGGESVPVSVAAAVRRDVPVEIQVIGNVEAYSTVTVRAQVTGLLQHVHFKEGDFVRKGELLFSIDPSPFEAALEEAVANLERSEALLAQAEATLSRDIAQEKYMRSQAARYTELFHQGVISRDQTEQLQAGADAQAQLIRADEASIRSARAAAGAQKSAVSTAKINLAYTTIYSPMDGRTGNLAIKQGNLVMANSMDLIAINQVQPIYVTFAAPESQLPPIKRYMAEHTLGVRARPQDDTASPEETGTLTFVDNAVDTTTGTIKLKGTFANVGRTLWPGQFVRVTLRLTTQANAVVVPNQAVQTGQNGSYVYVLKQDRTVESRNVVTGARVDQGLVVDQGLESGETVVTEGQLRLVPGSHVSIRGAGGKGGSREGKGGRGGSEDKGSRGGGSQPQT
jgi:multidrug efflux system membrane fusion protein